MCCVSLRCVFVICFAEFGFVLLYHEQLFKGIGLCGKKTLRERAARLLNHRTGEHVRSILNKERFVTDTFKFLLTRTLIGLCVVLVSTVVPPMATSGKLADRRSRFPVRGRAAVAQLPWTSKLRRPTLSCMKMDSLCDVVHEGPDEYVGLSFRNNRRDIMLDYDYQKPCT